MAQFMCVIKLVATVCVARLMNAPPRLSTQPSASEKKMRTESYHTHYSL